MPENAYTRDSGHLEGNQPEGAGPARIEPHGYFGTKTAGAFDSRTPNAEGGSTSESEGYASTGYPPDLTLPENDAGGQVSR